MEARLVVQFDEMEQLTGKDLGYSQYREVTQDMINTFADATDDHQWIHVDPERAKESAFGTAIAHGFLTLSLTVPMWLELFDVEGATTKVNYGLDRVRFTSPVPVGSRIRMHAVCVSAEPVGENGIHLITDADVQIEGQERPAVVLRFLNRFYK